MVALLARTILRASRPSSFLFSSSRAAMSTAAAPLLLSPKALAESAKPVTVLDASWFMPNLNPPRVAKDEFIERHIPGSQFLDLDTVASSHELGLKHMMPSGRVFADACEQYGISPDSHVVLYDTHGVFSSPRALFMFRSFGHLNSSILNGGLPLWLAESRDIQSGAPSQPSRATYATPSLIEGSIKEYDQMVANSSLPISKAEIVLDARSKGRFLGTDPEPRPGLSSGHMPNSFSLPFNTFLESTPGGFTVFRQPEEIKKQLVDSVGAENAESILKGEAKVATTCGSGMTAAVLWLGLQLLGVKNVGLYDESWTGYAMRDSSPIVKNT